MAYRLARPGQALAKPGLQAQARLDPREFGQAGPSFTEAWPAWPVGNTGYRLGPSCRCVPWTDIQCQDPITQGSV